jgi:transcriptional regulator with XRE-family HTH domain
MQTPQTQGSKIKQIAKKKGLHMKWLANKAGWSEAGLSRKINSGDVFTREQLTMFSNLLGVTIEYLQDTSRVLGPKDQIPEDAIWHKPPEQDDPQNELSGTLSKLMEIQLKNISHNQAMQLVQENKILAEAVRNVTDMVGDLMEEVRQLKEDRAGSHDPD